MITLDVHHCLGACLWVYVYVYEQTWAPTFTQVYVCVCEWSMQLLSLLIIAKGDDDDDVVMISNSTLLCQLKSARAPHQYLLSAFFVLFIKFLLTPCVLYVS